MSNEFVSVLRAPDNAFGATEDSPVRFEERSTKCCDVKFEYTVENGTAKVTVFPSGSPVKYLKLRFRGDMSHVDKVYGDQWERAGSTCFLEWRSVMSARILPWYCYAISGNRTACYGVKAGPDCFASWMIDVHGVTLFLNLTNGTAGTDLKEPLVACEIVELFGNEGEDPFKVASRFASLMCDKPVLAKEPIFGINNWYWAYGDITYDTVMSETDYLMKMCKGTKHRPYMIIDDGWQLNRTHNEPPYIGGPWVANERFGDMKKTADDIHAKGAKAGLWFRPLLTLGYVPKEAMLDMANCGGIILDPSHPYTLEKVKRDASTIVGWGYELIKHDFSVIDFLNLAPFTAEDSRTAVYNHRKQPFDKTKTNATIMKNLYKAIQEGAGEAEVIGCNTVSHLTAGIHSTCRVGGDTSGNSFEWTRRIGVNSVMRLPLNDRLYKVDPDCAAFTERVDPEPNLDYLEMCAITGMTTLASVKPGILSEESMKRINEIFLMADADDKRYGIKNYDKTANPNAFVSEDGSEGREFDWEKAYDGARIILSWTN